MPHLKTLRVPAAFPIAPMSAAAAISLKPSEICYSTLGWDFVLSELNDSDPSSQYPNLNTRNSCGLCVLMSVFYVLTAKD